MDGNGVSLGAVETAPIPELVRLRGQIFRGIVKAPFVKSGESVRGGVEVHAQTGKVKCHECGDWFDDVGQHLRSHSISARDYKIKHSLRQMTGLCSDRRSSILAVSASKAPRFQMEHFALMNKQKNRLSGLKAHGQSLASVYESRNVTGLCHAQVISRLLSIAAELGSTPSCSELRSRGLHFKSVLAFFNVKSIAEVMRLAGLSPRDGQQRKTFLIESLRNFYVARGRLPLVREFGSEMPRYHRFLSSFGSIREAYEAAGLGLVYAQKCKRTS